jgi:hypothetical protein
MIAASLSGCSSYRENNKPFRVEREKSLYNCTKALAKFRNDKLKYSDYGYVAFAKGRAFTETGMFGCGWSAYQKTQADADTMAMDRCAKLAVNPSRCVIIER